MNAESGGWIQEGGFHRRRPGGRSEGFTLLELLIVITLITILVSIGIPTYKNARIRGQVAAAHANLKGTIRENGGEKTVEERSKKAQKGTVVSIVPILSRENEAEVA